MAKAGERKRLERFREATKRQWPTVEERAERNASVSMEEAIARRDVCLGPPACENLETAGKGKYPFFNCKGCTDCKGRSRSLAQWSLPRSRFDCPLGRWPGKKRKDAPKQTMQGFRVLDMNLSDRCNLSCGFCYARTGRGAGPDLGRSRRILAWFLWQAENSPRPPKNLQVKFYGGEPLLEWDDLKALVTEFARPGLAFSVVTNMTLLTQERLSWLVQNRVHISPSIDGCAKAQDTWRRYADDNRGSSQDVFKAAKRLLRVRPKSSVRLTVSPETVQYFFASIVSLHKLGFLVINSALATGIEWSKESLDIFDQQVVLATDWWIERQEEGNEPSLSYIRNIGRAITKGGPPALCSAGIHRVAINTKGWASPCHRFTNPDTKPDWILGSIFEDPVDKLLSNPLREKIANFRRHYKPGRFPQCPSCDMGRYCYGWCYWELMAEGRSSLKETTLGAKPSASFCRMWQIFKREGGRAIEAAGGLVQKPPVIRSRTACAAFGALHTPIHVPPAFARTHKREEIVVLIRKGHARDLHAGVIKSLEDHGHKIVQMDAGQAKEALERKPRAIVRWEEHGCLFVTRAWRRFIGRCYEEGVTPLSVDLGYFNHYNTVMFDRYRPDGSSSIIDEWPLLSNVLQPVPEHLREWWAIRRGAKQLAKTGKPITDEKYVALFPSWSSTLVRPPFNKDTGKDKDVLVARICEEIRKAGFVPVIKAHPTGAKAPKIPEGILVVKESDPFTNARVALRAANTIIWSSSVSSDLAAFGVPVTAIGRTWFNGLGVFYEAKGWSDLVKPMPVDGGERARWINWWFSRSGPIEWVTGKPFTNLLFQ